MQIKRTIFVDEQEFRSFLESHPEVEHPLMPSNALYQPLDVGNVEYFNLEQIILNFEPFKQFYLLRHPINNHLYLGDVNLGGHGGRFRIMRIRREDLFTNLVELNSWYDNFLERMWR
jgi:hypothetical protein